MSFLRSLFVASATALLGSSGMAPTLPADVLATTFTHVDPDGRRVPRWCIQPSNYDRSSKLALIRGRYISFEKSALPRSKHA
jgi:hypothetical protein